MMYMFCVLFSISVNVPSSVTIRSEGDKESGSNQILQEARDMAVLNSGNPKMISVLKMLFSLPLL